MKTINLVRIVILMSVLFCSSVFALELADAKDAGLVGEQQNGYLGAVVERPDVMALIADINAKRKVKYSELANAHNLTLTQVEKLAAQKAYDKTVAGHYVRIDGKWVKK